MINQHKHFTFWTVVSAFVLVFTFSLLAMVSLHPPQTRSLTEEKIEWDQLSETQKQTVVDSLTGTEGESTVAPENHDEFIRNLSGHPEAKAPVKK